MFVLVNQLRRPRIGAQIEFESVSVVLLLNHEVARTKRIRALLRPGSEWMASDDSFLIPSWLEASGGYSQRNKARPVPGLALQIELFNPLSDLAKRDSHPYRFSASRLD